EVARGFDDESAAELVAGQTAVAVGEVASGRDDEGRVGDHEVEPLPLDRLEQAALAQVKRGRGARAWRPDTAVGWTRRPRGLPWSTDLQAVEAGRQPGQGERPRVHVRGDH